jgi:site-specific recombinase XerD
VLAPAAKWRRLIVPESAIESARQRETAASETATSAAARAAYAEAVRQFFSWRDARGILELSHLQPVVIAIYVEQLGTKAAPTVKQHLAAIRMLFDWLAMPNW